VKSEGKTRKGGPKPDWIEDAGSVLSPEICIVVVREDNPLFGEEKADDFEPYGRL
jgi:hypothetical protein